MDPGDWISIGAIVVSSGFALWSALSARKSKEAEEAAKIQANRAVDAAEQAAGAAERFAVAGERSAAAVETQTRLAEAQAIENQMTQSRRVIVFSDVRNGRRGLAIRNESEAPIFRLHVDLVGGGGTLKMAWARGIDPVMNEAFEEVLGVGESTIRRSIFVLDGGPNNDLGEFMSHLRIRFRDSRHMWWERIGNGTPTVIEPLDD
jgi:hypothetical protein